ncbi:SH3 domain-containing protein [Desulfotruncus alcoholivorax]|uniref:SH3 domain-containing protein n=1 Tax=Desulfotruncus alcoholivorax TaxID=265477 RepID=UPI0009D699A2
MKNNGSYAVIVSKKGCNFRSAPVIKSNNVITVLPNGKTVQIVASQGDWYKVNCPQTGYIAKTDVK